MTQFHQLTVTAIRKTIRDAVVVSLAPINDADCSFTQGQYLTFRRDIDRQEIRRSYSICARQGDGPLQVGIKKVSGGAFSTRAKAPHYLAFVDGSGITPILSILRTGLVVEPNARFTLVYANRSSNTIMFREELEDLKNQHLGRFNMIHILEHGSQEIDLFKGRVDRKKCAALFRV